MLRIAKIVPLETKQHRQLADPKPVLLVVEDDAAVRNSLKFSLELDGFAVRLFADAEALLNEPLPSVGCLVIDYYLPDSTGLALLSNLRCRGVTLPAFLMTGHPSVAIRQRALDAGVTIVEKPLLGNALVETILCALALQRQ